MKHSLALHEEITASGLLPEVDHTRLIPVFCRLIRDSKLLKIVGDAAQAGWRTRCPGSKKAMAATLLASRTSSPYSQRKLPVRLKIHPDK